MGLKPIKKKRLFEEIIVAIEQYIKDENIKTGDRLPSENELSSIFNVSKTAVREAMSVLNANGIIETRPGSGIFLKDTMGESIVLKVTQNLMGQNELQEILEFRRGIEIEAAGFAAIRRTPAQLQAIISAHFDLVQANESGSVGIEEDYRFHYEIILASGNSIYKNVYTTVSKQLKEGIRISKMQSTQLPDRFSKSYREHELIIEALTKQDPKAASNAMRDHLVRNEEKIWSQFSAKKFRI